MIITNSAFFPIAAVVLFLLNAWLVWLILRKRFPDQASVACETVLRNMDEGIVLLDANDKLLVVNEAAKSFLGIKKRKVTGHYAALSDAAVEKLLSAVLSRQTSAPVEISTRSGSKIFRIKTLEVKDQPGKRLVIISDITGETAEYKELIAAGQEYRDKSEMFRLLADNMPELLWAKDKDNKYIFANKALCETLLHANDTNEPIGKTDLFFAERENQRNSHTPDWHTFGRNKHENDELVISTMKPNHVYEYGNVNGKFLFLDVWKTPIIDQNGNVTGVVGSARDITAQKKSVSEIYRRDRLLDAVSQATALLVQGENLDESINGALQIIGIASEVNRVYIFRNGFDPAYQLPVMSLCYEWHDGTLTPMIDDPRLQGIPYEVACPACFEKLSQGKIIVGNVRDFNEPDKIILWEQGIKSILITPVFIDKDFWGFIGFDDCRIERSWTSTEERLLAAAANTFGAAYLRQKNQDELVAAKEKAEESERLKSAFLANMSHEIRTPMNGILGFAGLLKEPRLTGEEQQEYISIIEKSGVRMLNIINDIISISKVESGQMKISYSETNINSQIEYIHTFFKPEALQKGLQLSFKNMLPENEAVILTDKEKIYAILTNLINNALKFTQEGAIEFGYVLKEMSDLQMLEYFVKDTGPGIREGQQDFIFERFRQGNEMLNRNYEGAGLGLSISKAYVEMLGGKIWVDSVEGQGSVFYFTIPYRQKAPIKNISEVRVDDLPVTPVNKLKILIAEDDEISEKLMVNALKKFSREILNVKTGIEAVETCRIHQDIDLIMMDIKMPGMDGYEATRQIRQFNPDVVIVAQTAFALSGDREKAVEAGCNEHLSKPIDHTRLQSILKKYF